MNTYDEKEMLTRFCQLIEQEQGAKAARGFRWRVEHYLFPDIDLKNKRFLDIGGGSGTYSFYAACRGAREIVCLEPEAAGSSAGMRIAFQNRAMQLNLSNVVLLPKKFQEYEPEGTFEVLFCHNAINHLDEEATTCLHKDPQAQQVYQAIFQKLFRLCSPGGYLIIADASRHSLYGWLGIKSPLTPTIEWHKHQPPEVWEKLASQAGFRRVVLRWRSPASLGRIGQLLIGNRLINFFLWAHFCLTLQKPG
ncbi:hypothetical protein HRbin15_01900 [bacterium HR15]|nr:hypothetical protein HRbin15_01900 [bacterium HR15]